MRVRTWPAFLWLLLAAPSFASEPAAEAAASPALQLQEHLHSPDVLRRVEGPALTFEAALSEALERNPELVALRRAFDAAKLRPSQERFLMAPTFEAQIWQWPVSSISPLDTNMYMFTAGQEIPGRGKRALRVALAERETALTENEIAVLARQVIDEVKQTYAELFLTRKEIDVHVANIGLTRQFADISAAKYETGRISQQDILKAVVELSKHHEDLVMLDERARRAEARLNTLLDRAPDAPIGPLTEPRERTVLASPAELQRLALDRHPELRGTQLAVERADAALAVARQDYKPDFFVSGGYMLMPRSAGAWTASLGITWPNAPWSRGRLDARVAEATAEIETARALQRVVENAIRFAVQDAYVRVTAAAQRATLLRSSIVPQSEQTLEVSRAAYQTDRVDFLALIDNQRVLLEAQLGYYRALSDFEQALADLEQAVGTELSPEMLQTAIVTE
ncbi:MAG: TolC family protein [Acidobacteria bacterium]|nr:TolC family protein [Acidobacteriota bacterium]